MHKSSFLITEMALIHPTNSNFLNYEPQHKSRLNWTKLNLKLTIVFQTNHGMDQIFGGKFKYINLISNLITSLI